MVFQHSRGRDFDLPTDTPTTQGLSLWCFNIVGGEFLTFPHSEIHVPTSFAEYMWIPGISNPLVLTFTSLCMLRRIQ